MDIHGIAPLLQVFDMPTAIRFYRRAGVQSSLYV